MPNPPRDSSRQFRTLPRDHCLCAHDFPEPSTRSREMYLSSGATVVLPMCVMHAMKYDQAIRLEVLTEERYSGSVRSQARG
jgi:hypothetical protein